MKDIIYRRARAASGLCPAGLILACTPAEQQQDADGLTSDMPLYAVKDLMARPGLLAEVRAVCDKWNASQRPMAAMPAVVSNNCKNADFARRMVLQGQETEKLRREAGIE